jgi:putative aldouronate transport system permease protein
LYSYVFAPPPPCHEEGTLDRPVPRGNNRSGSNDKKSPAQRAVKYLRENYQLYSLLLPGIVFIFIFAYIPMYGAQIAFRDFNFRKGIWGSDFAGMKHFIRYITSSNFWPLMLNTLGISAYSLAAGFPVPIILAFMINEVRSIKYKKTVQMITYMPHFISTVAICSMIKLFLDRSNGVFNLIIKILGGTPVAFLSEPAYFKSIFVISGIWQEMGWGTIIFLAALSAVDTEMVEAARIDGASRLQKILYIDFPTILPTIMILLLLSIGSLVSVGSEKILLLQNSLNMDASDVISTYVYRLGIRDAQYSFTTAIGLFNSVVNVLLLVSFNAISKKISEISLW